MSSEEGQRLYWHELTRHINSIVNKLSPSNIADLIPPLLQLNIIRGRGLFIRSIMAAQLISPHSTPTYAAVVAVINSKLPEIGELCVKRLVSAFRQSYERNDKPVITGAILFIAHLFNQSVIHELLILQICSLLLATITPASVDCAVTLIKHSGHALLAVSPAGVNGVFDRLRAVLADGQMDRRTEQIIEELFDIRRNAFADHRAVEPQYDLIDNEEQITHDITLDSDDMNEESELNTFVFDPNFAANEAEWKQIAAELLSETDTEEYLTNDHHDDTVRVKTEANESSSMPTANTFTETAPALPSPPPAPLTTEIPVDTDAELTNLRRIIYLTIQSSLDYNECAHKLLKLLAIQSSNNHNRSMEVMNMIIECCSIERTFEKYYALLAERFCFLRVEFRICFDELFAKHYALIHRFETNKIRNISKIFAYILHNNAMDWNIFSYITLTEQDTTSAARIFIKILFKELSELMGINLLKEKILNELNNNNKTNNNNVNSALSGIFPKENPKNIRFSINFFTAIGLPQLTDHMREKLKEIQNAPPPPPAAAPPSQTSALTTKAIKDEFSDSQSSDSDSESDSDSDSDSRSDNDSRSRSNSEDDDKRSRHRSSRHRYSSSRDRKRHRSRSSRYDSDDDDHRSSRRSDRRRDDSR